MPPATGRRTVVLVTLLVPAALFVASQYYLVSLTGHDVADGCIGVLLGLYICSHPAANAIDLLFFERSGMRRLVRSRVGVAWLLLNALVMLVGWFVIVIGAARFTGRAGDAEPAAQGAFLRRLEPGAYSTVTRSGLSAAAGLVAAPISIGVETKCS